MNGSGGRMKNLEGVFVVIVTPFTASGEVDHSGLEKNVPAH